MWGCGKPLSDETCLDKSMWVNQGIMGEILETIRQDLQLTPTSSAPDKSSNSSSSSEGSSSDSDTADDNDTTADSSSMKPALTEQSETM